MKKLSFLAGMLTTALIGGLGFSALAATGQLTLTVDPVNIQVNGATFAPKDAKGNDVPVFALNGTTYAPLRALAEAYGLTVGYDDTAKMATVGAAPATPETPKTTYSDWSKEDEAAYQEFKGLWEVSVNKDVPGTGISYYVSYDGDARNHWSVDFFTKMSVRFALEKYSGGGRIIMIFKDGAGVIGTVDGVSESAISGQFSFEVDAQK